MRLILFVEVYDDSIYEKDEITNLFSVYQDLNIEFVDDKNLLMIMMKDGLVQLIGL